MTLQLTSRITDRLPIEFDDLQPTTLRECLLSDIQQLPIWRGRKRVALNSLFDVSGDPTDETVELSGELKSVRRLGEKLAGGTIIVRGDVGDHLGSQMKSGKIVVHGSASDWVGAEMRGGLIHIHGDAGDHAGSAYRASPRGMRGGTLLINGNAGGDAGTAMRRGLIAIGGDCGDLAGRRMLAGTIVVVGSSGRRHGAGMKRGTIVRLASDADIESRGLLPTFEQGYHGRPPAVGLVFRELLRLGFPLPDDALDMNFDLFHGDMLEGGRGEVFLRSV